VSIDEALKANEAYAHSFDLEPVAKLGTSLWCNEGVL